MERRGFALTACDLDCARAVVFGCTLTTWYRRLATGWQTCVACGAIVTHHCSIQTRFVMATVDVTMMRSSPTRVFLKRKIVVVSDWPIMDVVVRSHSKKVQISQF
eukprot:SAG11_NODE_1141_length_5707_cov_14.979315_8_plen_105_part_00